MTRRRHLLTAPGPRVPRDTPERHLGGVLARLVELLARAPKLRRVGDVLDGYDAGPSRATAWAAERRISIQRGEGKKDVPRRSDTYWKTGSP